MVVVLCGGGGWQAGNSPTLSVGRTVGRVRPLTCPLSLKTVMETCSVLVLGDQAGGKTSLINRFLTGQYVATQVRLDSADLTAPF